MLLQPGFLNLDQSFDVFLSGEYEVFVNQQLKISVLLGGVQLDYLVGGLDFIKALVLPYA